MLYTVTNLASSTAPQQFTLCLDVHGCFKSVFASYFQSSYVCVQDDDDDSSTTKEILLSGDIGDALDEIMPGGKQQQQADT